jgi:putative transposase
MARRSRNFVPGCPAHVYQRGNNRQQIFHCDEDFRYYWRCLKEATGEHSVDVNAYVFMTNHVHLMLTPRNRYSVSKMMHQATRRYSSYFNKRYKRTGTLWDGRFRASVITTDAYFIDCHRYIDLNPVRAGMVKRAADYPWSTHRCYTMGEANPLVTPHRRLLELSEDEATRRRLYESLFDRPLEEETLVLIRSCTNACTAIGEVIRRGRPKKKK